MSSNITSKLNNLIDLLNPEQQEQLYLYGAGLLKDTVRAAFKTIKASAVYDVMQYLEPADNFEIFRRDNGKTVNIVDEIGLIKFVKDLEGDL